MFFLNRQFVGHDQDVRCLATSDNTIFSGSRDGTVREWQADSSTQTEMHQYRNHQGFVNSLAFSKGRIISGSQDATINVTRRGGSEPDFTLLGHSANVCALATTNDNYIISGSWDGTARLWQDGKCVQTMEGHEGAVWAVLHTDYGVLTGGADRTIRLWKDGRQIKNFPAGKDCIRALALHPLGFVSAGNDAVIRIHSFEGDILQSLEGHESFIYDLATTSNGDIFSVGEDRSLRYWQNGELMQIIAHPAMSVWSVRLMSNGDVVTGSSDAVVRIFTASSERKASEEIIKMYEESVAASSIPAQSTNIPNNLPGLEALGRPGKKGEVIMIRTVPEVVEAHQWSGGIWVKIGEVLGAASKKMNYKGKDWDFVFDVDIAEGQPPLKLPYNTEENPYEAANRFIAKNELDPMYQDQIVKFIESNTGGVPLGVPKTSTNSTTSTETAQRTSAVTPQSVFLTMVAGNVVPILQKIQSFAADLGPGLSLKSLDNFNTAHPTEEQATLLIRLVQTLPRDQRFPALDLLRLSIPNMSSSSLLPALLEVILQSSEFESSAAEDKVRQTNIMLSLRCLVNLYSVAAGLTTIQENFDRVLDLISPIHYPQNRNISLALSTFLLNAATLAHRDQSTLSGINLLDPVQRTLSDALDSEIQYRSLVALGTLLRIGEDVVEVAKDVYDVSTILRKFDDTKEMRIKEALAEIRSLLV